MAKERNLTLLILLCFVYLIVLAFLNFILWHIFTDGFTLEKAGNLFKLFLMYLVYGKGYQIVKAEASAKLKYFLHILEIAIALAIPYFLYQSLGAPPQSGLFFSAIVALSSLILIRIYDMIFTALAKWLTKMLATGRIRP
ncbi:MAG: hypothetical protein Q8Q32_03315 [bacterium]|nr:hypothetical protein [bacterium]